ncbi:hypothetical protein HPMG_00053 [Helicobacter pullorum MIT 98-5489]|uniref:Uncharacterized protein n=1 Tax=Helicobacter pullorum MIT 98-5489 TaxID=537972 RepID=C5EX52_9HELI|nr:hypothetical protein HPMG_00053 [Helicobacter pullorum MIT 98-5489]
MKIDFFVLLLSGVFSPISDNLSLQRNLSLIVFNYI